jgi:hypothetical protein
MSFTPPFQTPNASGNAKRRVRTAREECLDPILVLSASHPRRVLRVYIDDNYDEARPHQGIGQQTPISRRQPHNTGMVQRLKVLAGIINDY